MFSDAGRRHDDIVTLNVLVCCICFIDGCCNSAKQTRVPGRAPAVHVRHAATRLGAENNRHA
jgi:hypothetical protein